MTTNAPGATEHERNYRAQRRIRAAIDDVYGALTTHSGIAGWWTHRVAGRFDVDEVVRLEFDGLDEHIDLRQVTLCRPTRVQWLCIEHSSLVEWAGTTIEFTMSAADDSVLLDFAHRGLTPALVCFDDCRRGWAHFLDSLRSFAETGTGQPFGRE